MIEHEKIIMIGEGGVGKTTFRQAWFDDSIIQEDMIICEIINKRANFATKNIPGKKFHVWDIEGQIRPQEIHNVYYKGATGALCLFDVTNRKSFLQLKEWIQTYWNQNMIGKTPVLIIGNKCDLRENPEFSNQVLTQEAELLANELSILTKNAEGFSVHYLETSAKNKININKAFNLLTEEIISYKFKDLTLKR